MPEMKLWLLKRIGRTDWDEYAGFVVRAATEDDARAVARQGTEPWEDENACWLDPAQASCTELLATGEPGVILDSFKAG